MTKDEFNKASDWTMIPVTCENHPQLRWSCKKVALTLLDGKYRYNPRRNLFFMGETGIDCECPASKLYALIEE